MRASTFTKFGIGLVAVTLATCTLAAPASADPAAGKFGTLVGTGSDTTQDVVNGLSAAIGGSEGVRIASYDATGTPTITTRNGGVSFPRANNSGTGRDGLRVAIGQISGFSASVAGQTANWTAANTTGNVDFARSSSGPAAADTTGAGVLTYVPFAKDAVTFATSNNSVIPALSLGSAADVVDGSGVGVASLYSIYNGTVTRVITQTSNGAYLKVVNDAYALQAGETSTPIHAYVPAAGSGTRSFWIGKVGINETQITNKTVPVTATYGPNNTPIQEHDGAALANDPGAIVPFSIGQWVAQGNSIEGVSDRRAGAKLGTINGQAPTTGNPGSYELNSGFTAITRTVYNIVPSAEADDSDSLTNWAFVGTGSLICSQKDVIKKYGFGLLTGTGPNACGDISLRAYAPALSTVELSTPKSAVKYGSTITLTATVTSNNNGGGDVTFLNGDKELATVKVAKGATVATTTYKTTSETTVDDLALTAQFTPNLSGVAEDDSEVLAVDVQTATAVVKGSAASVKANKAPVVKVSVTASNVSVAGTVTVKEGSKTLKSKATLKSGKVNVTLPKLKKGTHKLVVTYNGSSTVATGKSSTITLKIK